MLLDDREVDGAQAAAALTLWAWGVALWALLGVLRQGATWFVFFRQDPSSFESFESYGFLFTALGLVGVGVAVVSALGAWRYGRAVAPRSVLQGVALVFAVDALIDIAFLYLSFSRRNRLFVGPDTLYDLLDHGWRIVAISKAAALILFFTRMARLSEALGSAIAPARVWAAVGAAGLWGAVVAANTFELLPSGGAGMALSAVMWVAVSGTALAVFLPHRAHLRGASSVGPAEAARGDAVGPGRGLEAAGRGLGMYHGAIISQISWLVIGNVLTLLVAKTGDMDGTKSLMVLVPIVALVIQCFALGGLVRFSSHLPPLHAAKGPAGAALGALGFNLLIGLITLGLVLRAVQGGRLRHMFDLQDQLPVLEGISALIGCVAAVALLSALERLDTSVGALKLAIPVFGGFVLLFKLLDPRDIGGPPLLVLGAALLITAIVLAARFLGAVRRTADAMRFGEP